MGKYEVRITAGRLEARGARLGEEIAVWSFSSSHKPQATSRPAVLRTSYFVLRTFTVLSFVTAFPRLAFACPVCGLGTGQNEWAYAVMSAILSALPLGMFAFGTVWLSRRVRQHDKDGAGLGARGSRNDAESTHID